MNKFKPKFKSQYLSLIEETYYFEEDEKILQIGYGQIKLPNYKVGVRIVSSITKNKNEKLTKIDDV